MEKKLRQEVLKRGEAIVITGPVLDNDLETIPSGVSVPELFFKIAFFPAQSLMLAYLIENQKAPSKIPLQGYQVDVDTVEQIVGFDFFSDLPDPLELALESTIFVFD